MCGLRATFAGTGSALAPTPAGPRDAVRDRTARQSGSANGSAEGTGQRTERSEWTPTPTQSPEPLTTVAPSNGSLSGQSTFTPPGGFRPTFTTIDPGYGTSIALRDGGGGDDGGFLPRAPTRHPRRP